MTNLYKTVSNCADSVRSHCNANSDISTLDSAIILGSGLSSLTLPGYNSIVEIDYQDITGMPAPTAPTHTGRLSIVSNGQKSIALCAGRQHLYEGYSAQQVSILIYTLHLLGVKNLVVTNAAGALNQAYRPGDVMIIEDHINATGQNPLVGQDETFGMRYPDMSDAYHAGLRQQALSVAANAAIETHQGTYIGVLGPSLETSAERRMFRQWGADAVGMSTVTEVIAANHCGMQVLGLSAITNMALGDEHQQADSIEQVLVHAAIAGKSIEKILQGMFQQKLDTK